MRLEPVESLAVLRGEGAALAERSGNVFATPEWLETWWRHFGRGRLRVIACREDDGRLLAVLPLYRRRLGPLRVLRFVGHGPGDELGPVCLPGDREAAGEGLRRALEAERFDVFVGEQLPGDRDWSALGGRELRREGSPVLSFDGASWEEYLASRSSNFRGQVRGRERKALREGAVFRAGDPGRLREELDTLFALHSTRWREGGSAFDRERERAFHRDFAALAQERGWLRLWFLEIGGRAVAAWYGFRFGGAECFYQSGRDAVWDRLSVGFVLLAHTIRAAREEGVDEYRFLRGGEDYKYRFATDDGKLVTVALGRGPLGWAALSLPRLRPA